VLCPIKQFDINVKEKMSIILWAVRRSVNIQLYVSKSIEFAFVLINRIDLLGLGNFIM